MCVCVCVWYAHACVQFIILHLDILKAWSSPTRISIYHDFILFFSGVFVAYPSLVLTMLSMEQFTIEHTYIGVYTIVYKNHLSLYVYVYICCALCVYQKKVKEKQKKPKSC